MTSHKFELSLIDHAYINYLHHVLCGLLGQSVISHTFMFFIESRCLIQDVVDLVFVIDTSGSISSSNFQLIREFAKNIATGLIHDSPRSAVGVILFGSSAHIEFNLQAYTSLSALLSAINHLPYSGGTTNTAEALTLLLSAAQNGTLGLRNDSKKLAIVITDGQSDSRYATLLAAAVLHASNIFDIFAVGVGGAYLTELEAIASSPELVFFTSAFDSDSLRQMQDRISLQSCNRKFHIPMYVRMYVH